MHGLLGVGSCAVKAGLCRCLHRHGHLSERAEAARGGRGLLPAGCAPEAWLRSVLGESGRCAC